MECQQLATVDFQNPFYCPDLPAAAYLETLRQTVQLGAPYQSNSLFYTFALRVLDRSGLVHGETAQFIYDSENDWIVGVNLGNRRRAGRKQRRTTSIARPPSKPHSPNVTATDGFTFLDIPPNLESTVVNQQGTKRKRELPSPSNDEMNIQLVPKYAKSILLANDSSFELDVRNERVNFDATGSPSFLSALHNGPEEPQATVTSEPLLGDILKRVLSLLPGIRLDERLAQIPDPTVQKVADFLAENGYMSSYVLKLFQHAGVESLTLAASLSEEDGLNICAQDVIELFGKANSFQHLTELSFSGSHVDDFNLVHIHHLPKLACLYLDNTGIGNEAVYLLVPLKRTLTRLSLATNPNINSESVPAMLFLAKLEFLSILNTNVDIVGLRILAQAIFEECRSIDIEIPYACEKYIDDLHTKYLVDPQPPLLSDPEECHSSTTLTLKKNLAAHAGVNPAIVASGTREEMACRLKEILTTRSLDLIVAQMLLGA